MQKATSLQGIKKREKKIKIRIIKEGGSAAPPRVPGGEAAHLTARRPPTCPPSCLNGGGRLGQHGPAARMRGAAPPEGKGRRERAAQRSEGARAAWAVRGG